jgi:hypothetical protein
MERVPTASDHRTPVHHLPTSGLALLRQDRSQEDGKPITALDCSTDDSRISDLLAVNNVASHVITVLSGSANPAALIRVVRKKVGTPFG